MAPRVRSLLAVAVWLTSCVTIASAQTYRWVDRNGGVHYSQGLESVPEEYRAAATQRGSSGSQTPAAATPLSPRERSAASSAVRSLKQLQSTTRAGLLYQDYVPRVADTHAAVDPLLDRAGSAATPLREALAYYRMASTVWEVKLDRRRSVRETLKRLDPPCRGIQSLLYSGVGEPEIEATVLGVQTLWTCAAEKIAEAQAMVEAAAISPPR
jgi:hypothetical protein